MNRLDLCKTFKNPPKHLQTKTIFAKQIRISLVRIRIKLLLLLTAAVTTTACRDSLFSTSTKTIICQKPGTRETVVYKTTMGYPLYRGGWSFTDVNGTKVLSTMGCHYDSSVLK